MSAGMHQPACAPTAIGRESLSCQLVRMPLEAAGADVLPVELPPDLAWGCNPYRPLSPAVCCEEGCRSSPVKSIYSRNVAPPFCFGR